MYLHKQLIDLSLDHEHSAHSHLIDDVEDVNFILLQLLNQHVQGYERSRTTDTSAVQTLYTPNVTTTYTRHTYVAVQPTHIMHRLTH